MTGEMSNPVDREEWSLHAAIADEFDGQLRAFDVYQGPYILVTLPFGVLKFWIAPAEEFPEYDAVVFRDSFRGDDGECSEPFNCYSVHVKEDVICAVRELIGRVSAKYPPQNKRKQNGKSKKRKPTQSDNRAGVSNT